jgi:hypothetical protein
LNIVENIKYRLKKPTSFVDVVEEMRKLTKTMRERNELLIAKTVQDLTWEVNAAKDKIIDAFKDELRNYKKVSRTCRDPNNKLKRRRMPRRLMSTMASKAARRPTSNVET